MHRSKVDLVDINKSFSFAFADNQWVNKLGIGALITLIPILNFAWTGYMVELMRNVMKDTAEPLPTWDDLGQKLTDGLMLFVAGFVYVLPILMVTCLPLSFMIVPAILSEYSDTQDIADVITAAGSAVFFCLLCVFFLYMLAFSVMYPAIMVLFARERTLASCFKFSEVFDLIRKNSSTFLTAWAVNIGVSLAASVALGIAQTILGFIPCVGWIAALALTFGVIVYTSVVYAHLFGQFGRIAFTGSDPLAPA
jgi:hypothetical protein